MMRVSVTPSAVNHADDRRRFLVLGNAMNNCGEFFSNTLTEVSR